eukprot:TRINITY_DN17354_c0_g1_i5.p1 TRINITY_DN17354_c0_g1~~TRINITY_DN17354_c0_g1_i5.p1  ORF type:complete len:211 (-),score=40.57 TRINITY_DN17354_c0_g1_i5:88-648(-)
MNEVLAPLYYTFCQQRSVLLDPTKCAEEAEPDAFFCFTNLMSEIRDRFMKSLDAANTGILASVRQFHNTLRLVDPTLSAYLDQNNVDPRFYSLRWLALLLSQEFELPDVLRLWDSLFSDVSRFQFLDFCCVAMLSLLRDTLLQSDFAEILQTLQSYPVNLVGDIQHIISRAALLRSLHSSKQNQHH